MSCDHTNTEKHIDMKAEEFYALVAKMRHAQKEYFDMKAEEFHALEAKMRHAQKEYFKTRSRDWLTKSKQLERAVDNEIQQTKETTNQTSLF